MAAKQRAIKSNLDTLDKLRDEDIDYSDIPELDDQVFAQHPILWPPKGRTRRRARRRTRSTRRT